MNAEEFFKQKKALKKASRRGAAVEEAGMGLTSLMDIVSIIVVYLLKSYASDPVLIRPSLIRRSRCPAWTRPSTTGPRSMSPTGRSS